MRYATGIDPVRWIRRITQAAWFWESVTCLREEGVSHELAKFGRPQVGGEDAFARDPVRIHFAQLLHRPLAQLRLLPANQHAVGRFEIANCCALR